jgi:tetratricopeptide (TPR) repeat protein
MNYYKALDSLAIRPVVIVLCAALIACLPAGGAEAAPETELSLKTLQTQKAGEMTKPILAAFQNGAAERPGAELLLIKAWALRSTGRHEEALAVYEEIVAAEPNRLPARFGKALCLTALKRTADNSLEIAAIGKKWPNSMEYAALKHKNRSKINKTDEKSEWEKSIEQYRPASRAEKLFKADWFFSAGRFDEALRLYDDLQEENPDEVLPFLREAEILVYRKRYQKALDMIDKITAANADCGAAWRIRGDALAGLNRDEEALGCYSKSAALGVDNAKLYGERGELFAKQRKYREALADYNLALERSPADYMLWLDRAQAYSFLGEQRKAYADLCKAADLSEDKLPKLYFIRGMMARSLGFRQDAITALEKYLQLVSDHDPDRASAVAVLADLSY